MFNTNEFKSKLEYALRQSDAVGSEIQNTFNDSTTETLMNMLWDKSLIVLWQTRFSGKVFMGGIDKPEEFKYFKKYLTISLNMFNDNIFSINEKYKDNFVSKLIEYNKLVKQTVGNIVVELDEYFKVTEKKS